MNSFVSSYYSLFFLQSSNWHACLFGMQALESFLLRCPRDIYVYCDEILNLTLEYLGYDPNFTDSMDEDIDDESHEEEDDEYADTSLLVLAC